MYTTKLQTPMDKKVLKELRKKSEEIGFSSANEVVRILVKNFVEGNIKITVMYGNGREISGKKESEYKKDIEELERDIKSGKSKSSTTAVEVMNQLKV